VRSLAKAFAVNSIGFSMISIGNSCSVSPPANDLEFEFAASRGLRKKMPFKPLE
jgi:hypothetical protein